MRASQFTTQCTPTRTTTIDDSEVALLPRLSAAKIPGAGLSMTSVESGCLRSETLAKPLLQLVPITPAQR
jgi:hypothetical protein